MTLGTRVTQAFADALVKPAHAAALRVSQEYADVLVRPTHAAALRVSQEYIDVLVPSLTVPLGVRVTQHSASILMSATDVVSNPDGIRQEIVTF